MGRATIFVQGDIHMAERVAEGETAKPELDRVKADLARLREDFTELFAAAMDLSKIGTGTAKEKLESGVAALKDAAKAARARGDEAVEQAQDCIRRRPLTSLAIAFGVGLLTAAVLDRSRR